MCKSKCTKHSMLGPSLEVGIFKNARCCDAKHISKWKIKSVKTWRSRGPVFDVQMPKKYTPLRPETHFQVKMSETRLVRTIFGRSDIPWASVAVQANYTTIHYITLNCATLHFTTLYFTTPHYITPHHTTLHYITLHYTTLHYLILRYTNHNYNHDQNFNYNSHSVQ